MIKYPYMEWENLGMYKLPSDIINEEYYKHEVNLMFNDNDYFLQQGLCMINEYKKACSTFLYNKNINRLAFIGQSTAYYYCKSPEIVTKSVFKLLSIELQNKNNKIAKIILNEYLQRMQNIQRKMDKTRLF